MLNYGLPPLVRPEDCKLSIWLEEYIEGTTYEICGFLPAIKLVGWTFLEVAQEVAKGDVVLLAAQIQGRIVLNPGDSFCLEYDTVSLSHPLFQN